MEDYNEANPMPARLARFMFLFRTTLPDLYVSELAASVYRRLPRDC